MKKLVLLIVFVSTVAIVGSCTTYTCPTYSLENTQQAPTQLEQVNI